MAFLDEAGLEALIEGLSLQGRVNYATFSSYADSARAMYDNGGSSATRPIYLNSENKPAAISYTIEKSVPANAVFTDTTYSAATQSVAGLMSAADKTKLDGIATNANNYTHPSATAYANGLYKITTNSLGHVTAATAVAKSDITGLGIPAQDTTYGIATSSTAGLVKSGTDITVDTSGNVSVVNDSHTHSNSTITSLDASKVTSGTFAAARIPNIDASKITSGTISIDRLPAGALERLVTVKDETARFALTTSTVQLGDTVKQLDTGIMYIVIDTGNLDSEDGYMEYTAGSAASVPWSGVTGKPSTFTPSSHTHTISQITDISNASVASAKTATSATTATTATKLGSSTVGSPTQPIYLNAGTATACTYTLGKSVPSNAVFTDTTYSAMTGATTSAAGTSGLVPAPAAGSATRYLRSDGTWTVPPNTTYSAATTSAAGLMSASDKSKLDGITSSADSVSFSRSLTSGTVIGTLTINGTATTLYCQTNTDTTYSAITTTYIDSLF